MIELGNTCTIHDDNGKKTADLTYSFLKESGTCAVLIDGEELNDSKEYFKERMKYPVPHVLSNVIPRESDSLFGNIEKYHAEDLSNGSKLIILNLLDPIKLEYNALFKNYKIIKPFDYLQELIPKLDKNDVVIVRLSSEGRGCFKDILASPVADRIDLFLLKLDSYDVDLLTQDELKLVSVVAGWDPTFWGNYIGPPDKENYYQMNPHSNPNIKPLLMSLNVEQHNNITVTNKHRVVPEPRSNMTLREIHFQRDLDGSRKIDVSDMILYREIPKKQDVQKRVNVLQTSTRFLWEKKNIVQNFINIDARLAFNNTNLYAGSDKCKKCHWELYNIWEASEHSIAYEMLKPLGKENDPSCLSCHLTEWLKPPYWPKWNFSQYGPELGCESCHGPCLAHIDLMKDLIYGNFGRNWIEIKNEFPHLLTRENISECTCRECHDYRHSPNFNFDAYLKKIEHSQPEMDELPRREDLNL